MQQAKQPKQIIAQSLTLPLVLVNQEGIIVERAKTTLERTVTAEAEPIVPIPEVAPLSTPMPKPTSTTTSQDVPTTLTIANTLLLLTFGPRFDRTTTQASFESTKSSAANTEKLPFREPSTAEVFPNVAEVQMANQHILHLREEWTKWNIYCCKC